MTTLHITAGDSTIELLKETTIEGEYLPWRDLLHEGPVPFTETLEELSNTRSEYIHSKGWGDLDSIKHAFKERDKKLYSANSFDTIVLWFEHDLYDQLQLIQILSILSEFLDNKDSLYLINTNRHLGHHQPQELVPLYKNRQNVTQDQFHIASIAWQAFRRPTPECWFDLLDQEIDVLPFLRKAVRRMLQELPDSENGLSKTQNLILNVINEDVHDLKKIFKYYTQIEEDEFLGDWSFSNLVESLATSEQCVLEKKDNDYFLTKLGRQLVNNHSHWLDHYIESKWFGGYHQFKKPFYLWCNKNNCLVNK